jgi:lysophospholipase L1-like esterase
MSKKSRSPKSTQPELSPAKKRLFTFIGLSIPVLFILGFEIALRLANYGGDTTLFVPTPSEKSDYLGINRDVCKRYFYKDEFVPSPRKDLFLKEKPGNSYRIFVLGGSSTAGFPYGNNLTFTRILQRRLVDLFPEKRVEVVNCAFTAINTYTLLDFMDEILAQQPDLLLMYAGHNEFYGALGVSSMESLGQSRWFVKAYLQLQRFKIFIWTRNSIIAIRQSFSGSEGKISYIDPTQTVMARIVKDKKIPYGSTLYKKGIAQFYGNVEDIIKKAKKADVPIILSEVVSNVRDQQPFVSVETDDLPAALTTYNQAQQAETAGDYPAAQKLYTEAKDLDALRFRASEDINAAVHELGQKYALPVVPMKKYFEQASPHGLIGENLMWEHLHPKSNGYFVMADAFFHTIREHNFIVDDWERRKYLPSQYYESNWGLSTLDSVHAELGILQLKGSWPFVQDGSPNLFMTQFKPSSREEQIVFDILANGKVTLEQGHIKLAEEYEKSGDYVKAFQERMALVYTVPNLELFYEPLVEMLVGLKEYELILRILLEASRFQDSAYINKWIGQTYLAQGETERGLVYLEKAVQREPNDLQSVYNMTRAYFNLGRIDDGNKGLEKLRGTIGGTKEFQQLLEFRQKIIENK